MAFKESALKILVDGICRRVLIGDYLFIYHFALLEKFFIGISRGKEKFQQQLYGSPQILF